MLLAAPTCRSRRSAAQDCPVLHILPERVIAALDVPTIIQVPISYSEQGFDETGAGLFRHPGATAGPEKAGAASSTG